MKIYYFGVELQSGELNLVLRKTAMIVRQVPLVKKGRFRKSTVWISNFWGVINSVKEQSGFQCFFAKSCEINEISFSM